MARRKPAPAPDLFTPAAWSLVCLGCDAGEDVRDREAAEAAGWTDLDADDAGPWWTATGWCPECKGDRR